MENINLLSKIKLNNTAVTIGKFDGIHKGHTKLFDVLKENACGRETIVLTFAEKPIDVLNNCKTKRLVTEDEKNLLCDSMGIDYYISLPLTKDFLDLSPEAFIKDVLIDKLDMSLIVCGPDFTFGRFGAGDTTLLKKMSKYYGYEVIVVEKEQYKNADIGSTGIREAISNGNIEDANEMLGHPFSVIGKIEKGKQLGRTIGFPTANIFPSQAKLLPPRGVYRTKIVVDSNTYDAITNIGINPTVSDEESIKVETHIPDENIELYEKIVEVQFFDYIRPEKKFDGLEDLKRQISEDVYKVKSKAEMFKK